MADLAKRLCGPVALTTSAATYYTTPAATTTIVRSIHVANTSTSNPTFTLGINGVAATQCLWSAFILPANGSLDWSGFLVLVAGDTLSALASTAALSLTASGVEST